MYLELVMDIGKSDKTADEIQRSLPQTMDGLNGVFTLKEFIELN